MAPQRGATVSDGDVKHLLDAPKCLQNKIVDMIDEQIAIRMQENRHTSELRLTLSLTRCL